MAIKLSKIINSWVPENSKVIDFGCGDGSLLKELFENKQVLGYGVEINDTKIEKCIEKGVPVIKLNIDKGLNDFMSSDFDLSIMARSIQCLKNPDLALNRMLKLSKRCVVTLPNLGYWRCRINLALGKMPITPDLPSSWYETENIHLCTIKDFENLCLKENINIKDKVFINRNGDQGGLSKINPNLFAVEGVYLLEK
ncbi:MAG: methionine biosynthesis protein MetW [SAR86 cluster bacterium]|jgi:methionine biosynthesis protein MetW|uniref:Methionine biosynthesis protein MetW n=1 Tax=SAR86 cluster bacterium TaxID=2030880 RepID=A0A520N482_9GAMM|nr:MAG: methionine biosynthesis protein MetW [SAR86 cluster bacterium]|tara:strand:- start:2126 stop:2716 length:591 start_codon:yes stop_codon:yes gene_type:complete